ncbi:hypothetical protein Tco_0792318, partial [Tanacetum coccineum]
MITNSQEYLSSRVRSLESINNELRFKIQELHREIIQIIQTSPTTQPSSSISQKEAEMKNLTDKLLDLERQNIQKRIHLFIDDHGGYINPLLQGRLRDLYHSLGEYRQLQIQQSISPEAFMSIIYSEFIGSPQLSRDELVKLLPEKWITNYEQIHQAPVQSTSAPEFVRHENGLVEIKFLSSQPKGHFARNCPDKKRSKALIQALNQVESVDVSDLEPLYSLDDEPSESVLCTIAYSDFSSDDDSDIDSLESDSDFGVHMINLIRHVLPIQKDPPLPLEKVHLLTDAYAKPIQVIAFFDTGSSASILNPNILPDHYWKPHHQNFMAANGEKF